MIIKIASMTNDETEDLMRSVVEETKHYSAKDTLSREQYRELTRSVHCDLGQLLMGSRSFFLLGSYADAELKRLTAVQSRLNQEGEAFLMKDTPELWEFWTTQFKILANRATHIVGVFEHAQGGHEWEAGYLDHERYRHKTRILKREYTDRDDPTDEPFDGMFAHYIRLLHRLGRVYHWDGSSDATDDELEQSLLDATDDLIEDLDD